MAKVTRGGGWPAVGYTWTKAREAGGIWKLWKALRSKNACKTCALGMGGQQGGMVNEAGQFPQVCKKSLQAMVADMQGPIRRRSGATHGVAELRALTPRELERAAGWSSPCCFAAARPTTRRSTGTRRSSASPPSFGRHRRTRRSGTSAAAARTRRLSCCSCSPASTAPTTSTIVSYYCHQASGVGLAASPAAARRRSSSTTSSTPTSSSSSAATRPAIIRG